MACEEEKGLGLGAQGWAGLATAKGCDSCKSEAAVLFCRADSAFLCLSCDAKIHGANKLASRHERVWVCEVCEQAPAAVTCKADAAALCVSCDRDIHSANPLARRHDRLPVVPFFDSPASANAKHPADHLNLIVPDHDRDHRKFVDEDDEEEEEDDAAEAESWLLSNPNPNNHKLVNSDQINNYHHQHPHQIDLKSSPPVSGSVDHYLFSDVVDPYLDLDYGSSKSFQFLNHHHHHHHGTTDSVVPVVHHHEPPQHHHHHRHHQSDDLSDHLTPVFINSEHQHHHHSLDMDHFYRSSSNKPTSYSYSTTTAPSLSQSVSSSSMEVGVVPDGISDVSNPFGIKNGGINSSSAATTATTAMEMGVVNNNNNNSSTTQQLPQVCGVDREARVLRYREKRKNRKFEKTIRYASRKAYAETRPRIKGRFAKRTEIESEVDRMYSAAAAIIDTAGYGIVPSF